MTSLWPGRAICIALVASVVVIFATDNSSLRWGLATVLLMPGLLLVGCNWLIIIKSRSSGPQPSLIPLAGSVLIAIAIARMPVESWNRWWWVAFLLDPVAWMISVAIPTVILDVWRHRQHPDS